MKIEAKTIEIETCGGTGTFDITRQVKDTIFKSGIANGQVVVFTRHTTAALAINENEPRLLCDIARHLEANAPIERSYLHDDTHIRGSPAGERKNGHAHIKALSLCASQSIPLIGGQLALGKWQSILFFELDGGRKREIIVHVMGV